MGKRQDFLVFGLDESLGTRGSAKDLVKEAHDRGGLVIAAHPFKPSRLGVGYHGAGDDIYELDVDALELFHPSHDQEARQKVRVAAQAMDIPMTAGSDAHELYQVGAFGVKFPDPVETIWDIMEQIRSGNAEPVNGDNRI
jgi:hypothetical protein